MVMMTMCLLSRSCGHDLLAQTTVGLLQLQASPGLLTSLGSVTCLGFCTHNISVTFRPSHMSRCTSYNVSAVPAAAACQCKYIDIGGTV
jgi:hypothetical protein